jgi:nucleoside-diphosphate-sugar epimerase
MRIAVTGATGFIGGRIAACAVERGHEVVALAREPARAPAGTEPREWDMESAADPGALLMGVDALCHAAAFIPADQSDLSPETAARCFSVNVGGTLRLLAAAESARVQHFVNLSAGNAYHPAIRHPDESAPLYPCARAPLYLTSKIGQEIVVDHWRSRHELNTCSLRAAAVYGPGQSRGAVPRIATSLFRGEEVRLENGGSYAADFVHVEDVAEVAVRAAEESFSGPVNVGSGERTTLRAIGEILVEALGVQPRLLRIEPAGRPEEDGFPALDISLARDAFGFTPRPVAGGMHDYARWLRATPGEKRSPQHP